MGVDEWSTNEAQNASLGNYDVSRGECPDASTSEHARVLMANIKALSDSVDERFENFVGENIEVDGITIENNEGTLTVVDVAIGGDTEELLTDKIAEIEAAAETASGKAEDAETAAGQAADSATAAVAAVSDAVDAANLAAAQATQAASAAARAQAGAALAESAVQAVAAGTNLNWQKSEKAGSVAIYPVPETTLELNVEYIFTETGPESGDKGPENPSAITGVDSIFIRRTGDNLVTTPYKWFADSQSTSYTDHGVTYTLNPDNSITINGTANGNSYFALLGEAGQDVWFPAGAYRVKATGSSGVDLVLNYSSALPASTADATHSFPVGFYGRIYYRIISGTAVNNFTVYPQIFLNDAVSDVFSVAPELSGTIPLGSTYYGGAVDLATGVMTVTWGGAAISSFTAASANTDTITCVASAPFRHKGNVGATNFSSNRFESKTGTGDTEHVRQTGGTSSGASGLDFYIAKTRLDVSGATDPSSPTDAEWLAAANAWLADNPVFFVGRLFSPQTVQLTPQQIISLPQTDKYAPQINTIYTDQQAVQVGYAKSPIRSEHELTQALIATEGGE